MNTKNNFKNLTHAEVQQALSAEPGALSADQSSKIQQHLAGCNQCADYAKTLALLDETGPLGHEKQSLTLQEKAAVVNQIDARLQGADFSAAKSTSLNLLGSAAVALVAILIMGAFVFTLSRPETAAVAVTAPVEPAAEELLIGNSSSDRDYDGWELGVAFDIPDAWSQSEFVIDELRGEGAALIMGQNLYDFSDQFPPPLALDETFGFVLVSNFEGDASQSADAQLRQFHDSRVANGVPLELGGKRVIISKREIVENGQPLYFVDVSLLLDGRFVQVYGVGNFGGKDDSDPIVRQLAEILASMESVDYTGWQMWTDPEQEFALIYPDQLRPVAASESVIFDQVEADLPFRFSIDYNRNVTTGDSLETRLASLLEDLYSSIEPVEGQLQWSPDQRPDLIFGRYDQDGSTLLAGVLENPDSDNDQPFVVASLFLDAAEADAYQPQFERILRSMRWQPVLMLPPDSEPVADAVAAELIGQEFTLPGSNEGSGVWLNGVQIDENVVQLGDELSLNIEWEARKSIAARYKVFIHLFDATGLLVANLDAEPQGGNRPTDSWQAGEVILDQQTLLIPASRFNQPGEHTLVLGLYDAEGTGERLLINGENQLEVGQISVVGPGPTAVPIPADQETIRETNYGIDKEVINIDVGDGQTVITMRVYISSRWGMTTDPAHALPNNAIMHSLEFPRLYDQAGQEIRGSGTVGGQLFANPEGGHYTDVQLTFEPLRTGTTSLILRTDIDLIELRSKEPLILDLTGRDRANGDEWRIDETVKIGAVTYKFDRARLTSERLELYSEGILEEGYSTGPFYTMTAYDTALPLAYANGDPTSFVDTTKPLAWISLGDLPEEDEVSLYFRTSIQTLIPHETEITLADYDLQTGNALVVEGENIASDENSVLVGPGNTPVEIEFKSILLGSNQSVVQLALEGPELDQLDPRKENSDFYQFGFPTTLSTENGTVITVSTISVLQEMTDGRLNRLVFDPIPEIDQSDTLTLTGNFMFREYPADRMISLDLTGRQPGEAWQINETLLFNDVPVSVETAQLGDAGTSLQLLLAPVNDLEQHVLPSITLTVLFGDETVSTAFGSIDGNLWLDDPGLITIEAEFEARPEGIIDLFFDADIQYLERYEFLLDAKTGAEIEK